jgi:sigma-B regulation protein RsbU (phosphoserine phosphatase)
MVSPRPSSSRREKGFWERVTEGLALEDLWTQFSHEARAGYDLYAREVDWEALRRESRWKQPFQAGRGLFWALLLKLSPARRVLLLVALALALLTALRASSGTPSEQSLLLLLLPPAILVLLLALELADRLAMKRDLEIARDIQRWLAPEKPPQVPGLDLAFATQPANTVGGDYHDAFLRRSAPGTTVGERLLLVVADVAGKSVPAALLMATFQASLRTLAASPVAVTDLVVGLNRSMANYSHHGLRFTTTFLAEVDPASRELVYINAGHNAPILRRASGALERLEAGGMPLGIFPDASYDCGKVVLGAGDTLVAFTDGVIEAVNESNEMYGEERLLQLVGRVSTESVEGVKNLVFSQVNAFVGQARRADDITCLVLRVL